MRYLFRCCFLTLFCLVGGSLLSPVSAQAPRATHIVIDKNRMTLTLYAQGDTLMHFPVSCGRGYGQKQMQGDMRTPEGTFRITQITDASAWGHDFGDGLGYIPHAYGPWFIRLSAGNGIGIHGTHDPASMGLRASEGCIRLRNEDLLKLRPCLYRGLEVTILPDSFPLVPAPTLQEVKRQSKQFRPTIISDLDLFPITFAQPDSLWQQLERVY